MRNFNHAMNGTTKRFGAAVVSCPRSERSLGYQTPSAGSLINLDWRSRP